MAKKRKRARLIYNPTSGQEIMKKHVAEVLDIVENAGFETSAFQTTATPNSARDEAKRAAKTGFDLMKSLTELRHCIGGLGWLLFQLELQMILSVL